MTNNIINNIKYAYVTVILKEIYLSAALVFAESVRDVGSSLDLVIFVSTDIHIELVNILKMFYDKIIMIDEYNCSENIDLLRFSKLQKIFEFDNDETILLAKMYAYSLTEYDKIIIVNVDTILLKLCNNMFTTKTPAFLYNDNELLTDIMIIKPNSAKLNNILEKIVEEKFIKKNKSLVNYLYKKYKNHATVLDKKIINFSNDDLELNERLCFYQYKDIKPFILKNEISIEKRVTYENLKLWFLYYKNIINKYPELLKCEDLREVNELLKYYTSSLSRFIISNLYKKNLNLYDQVHNLYKIKSKKNLLYYHLNISKEYDAEFINYHDENLLLKDFIIQYNKTNNNLININSSIKSIVTTHVNESWLENFLFKYACNSSNISLIVIITPEKDLTDFSKDKNVLYVKKLRLNGDVVKNILFCAYQRYVYKQRVLYLSKYDDNRDYKINILIYQTLLEPNINSGENTYIFGNKSEKISGGSIFLNNNTIKYFRDGFEKIIDNNKISNDSLVKILKFQTIKKWIYNMYDGDAMNNIILVTNPHDHNIIILDDNEYNFFDIKKINNKLIDFIEVIFSKSVVYKNKLKDYKQYLDSLHNSQMYWMLEGIKIINLV
jgi:hypothetical protein